MTWDPDSLNQTTGTIIGCAFKVANTLGAGFGDAVYKNALAHEMGKQGLDVERRRPVRVVYDGAPVGDFSIDFVVQSAVLLELKAAREHHDFFTAQCLNYLKATGLPICLLLNFGRPRLEIKRFLGRGWRRDQDEKSI